MNQGLFQFNNTIINEIVEFASSSYNLFFIQGPKGSSRRESIEKAVKELEIDNLVFSHFCFENTVIDDFLLNFYDALRNFTLASRISLKKFASNDFKEKVSHYFKSIVKNCIIVVENFEKVENNIEIIDFLSHLASFVNIKLVIITANESKNPFEEKIDRIKNYTITTIPKADFIAKLAMLIEPIDNDLKDKFYKITKGSELYLRMCIKYCSTTDVTLKDLINEFDRKNIEFEEFLVSKFVSLTPSSYLELFRILCAINHPVSKEFIEEYKLSDTNYIEYLSKNFLISFFKDEIYVKDYYKQYITKNFSLHERALYYKNLVRIYQNELTKSPQKRLLRLSRESIRKEIEFFNSLIPSINSKGSSNMPYLGIKVGLWKEETKKKSKLAEKLSRIKEKKEALQKKEQKPKITAEIDKNKEKNRLLIIDLINHAHNCEKNFDYTNADKALKKALSLDYDSEFRIEILMFLLKNYIHLNELDFALKAASDALEIAIKTNDSRRVELEFLIAKTNKDLYRLNRAEEKFENIIKNENNKDNYRSMSALELGEVQEAKGELNSAINNYKLALNLSLGKNKELVCKSYYKLALLYDENSDYKKAEYYYQKNYLTSSDKKENNYYSISLTNLASIYTEQTRYQKASECLKLALEFDTLNEDWQNIYFSQKELAKLYIKIDPISAQGYFTQALKTAQQMKDNFKIALVYFDKGEFFYDTEDDKKALINFLEAKKALRDLSNNDENIARIKSRIKDLRIRLGNDSFDSIIKNYDKN